MAEIDIRDRVDISLEYYEKIKADCRALEHKCDKLSSENAHLTEIFNSIGISSDMIPRIIPNSIFIKNNDGFDEKKGIPIRTINIIFNLESKMII